MPRLLGVDPGEARIGIATCDPEGRFAVPLTIIERRGRALDRVAEEIAALSASSEAEGIVVGLPLNMDGTEGAQARHARSLGRRIATAAGLPVHYWDERLSSFAAEQLMAEAPRMRRRRGGRIDDLAAAVILQSFLDGRGSEQAT
jgi:putative Holliday junction resolvase